MSTLLSVPIEPLAILASLGIPAVRLGLLKGQATLDDPVGLLTVRSVEANDTVHVSPF